MGSVQLKLHVFRIRLFEDEIQICRILAESVQVVVVAKRDANIGSSFTQFSEEPAKPLALIGSDRPRIRRELIQYLKIKTA